MNKTKHPDNYFKIYDASWIGLLQSKVVSIKSIEELMSWLVKLEQNNLEFSPRLQKLISECKLLVEHKNLLTNEYESLEAKLILLKDALSNLIIQHFSRDLDNNLRKKYISKCIQGVQDFEERWNFDVDFREGNNDLLMLFVFLWNDLEVYNEASLVNIFQILNDALTDPNEIVQANIVRGFLINIVINPFEKTKYTKYMPQATLALCQSICSFWYGEGLTRG